jgi:hypothetical protein
MAHEQLGLERVGMIEVDVVALLDRERVEVAVVRIVRDPLDAVLADMIVDRARDRGLARAGAAGDADDDGRLQACSSNSASVMKSEGSSLPHVEQTTDNSLSLLYSNW